MFVLSANGRLRYANPAWERLTGRALAKLRGTRVSATRQSASPLWRSLGPPEDVWAGRATTVRRPLPDADVGPPWWDVSYLPVPGEGRPLAVIGTVHVAGELPARGDYREPAAVAALRQRTGTGFALDRLQGRSVAADRLLDQARHAASSTAPVWLVGEPGSGKATLARIIHANGPGRDRAFVGIDAATLEAYLADGLLFGKGGLLTSRVVGTLYLARPAGWSRDLQQRIADHFTLASANGPRLICGSPTTTADDFAGGRLIAAFHTRLSVVEIRVPPLRERPEDLKSVVDQLLPRFDSPSGQFVQTAEGLFDALTAYPWPGNIRELDDVLATAVDAAGDTPVGPGHLPRRIREHALIAHDPRPPAGREWALDELLEAVERRLIGQAVRDARGSQAAAAERLGIPRARLGRRIDALGIEADGRPREGECDTHK